MIFLAICTLEIENPGGGRSDGHCADPGVRAPYESSLPSPLVPLACMSVSLPVSVTGRHHQRRQHQ